MTRFNSAGDNGMAETDIEISKEQVQGLSDKLDRLSEQLSDDEKTMLLAVFALAHAAIEARPAEVDDVEGFARGAGRGGPLPSVGAGFASCFSPGGPSGIVSPESKVRVKVKGPITDSGIGVKALIY